MISLSWTLNHGTWHHAWGDKPISLAWPQQACQSACSALQHWYVITERQLGFTVNAWMMPHTTPTTPERERQRGGVREGQRDGRERDRESERERKRGQCYKENYKETYRESRPLGPIKEKSCSHLWTIAPPISLYVTLPHIFTVRSPADPSVSLPITASWAEDHESLYRKKQLWWSLNNSLHPQPIILLQLFYSIQQIPPVRDDLK